jgi:hypothetical protein
MMMDGLANFKNEETKYNVANNLNFTYLYDWQK